MKGQVDISFSCSRNPAQSCTKVVGKARRVSLRVDSVNPALVGRVLDTHGRVVGVNEGVGGRTVALAVQVDGRK